MKWCLLLLVLGACTATAAGPDTLPDAEHAQRTPTGSYLRLEIVNDDTEYDLEGELIAVDQGRIFVKTAYTLAAVPPRWVKRATLIPYKTEPGAFAAMSTLGTLSTLTHGVWLIFTMPAWGAAGGAISAGEADAAVSHPTHSVELRKYARFPQGLPPGLDQSKLGHLRRTGDWGNRVRAAVPARAPAVAHAPAVTHAPALTHAPTPITAPQPAPAPARPATPSMLTPETLVALAAAATCDTQPVPPWCSFVQGWPTGGLAPAAPPFEEEIGLGIELSPGFGPDALGHPVLALLQLTRGEAGATLKLARTDVASGEQLAGAAELTLLLAGSGGDRGALVPLLSHDGPLRARLAHELSRPLVPAPPGYRTLGPGPIELRRSGERWLAVERTGAGVRIYMMKAP